MNSLPTDSTSESHSMHISRAEEILNKECGWKALTGTTDFGKITALATSTSSDNDEKDVENARLAVDLFVDRIAAFVGSYFVSLRGDVDALVFAGGIGEKSVLLRRRVCEEVECLGFEINTPRNDEVGAGEDADQVVLDAGKGTGNKGGKRILVCRTDEQLEMARICRGLGE